MNREEIKPNNMRSVERVKELLDDPRTGLRNSSDTNKTRMEILGIVRELTSFRTALLNEIDSITDEWFFKWASRGPYDSLTMVIPETEWDEVKSKLISLIKKLAKDQ